MPFKRKALRCVIAAAPLAAVGLGVFWWHSVSRPPSEPVAAQTSEGSKERGSLDGDALEPAETASSNATEEMSAARQSDATEEPEAPPYNVLDEMLGEGASTYGRSTPEEIEAAKRAPTRITHRQESTDPRFEDPASLRDEYVRFETPLSTVAALMESEEATLPITIDYPLFEGERIGFVVRKHERQGELSGVLVGEVEGYAGSFAVMAYNDLAEVGTLSIPGRGEFRVTYAGEGVHRISELDVAAIPPCGTPEN